MSFQNIIMTMKLSRCHSIMQGIELKEFQINLACLQQ